MRGYNRDFFKRLDVPTYESARVIVPLLLKLIQPKSVIDIGCGTGGWLSVFQEYGVQDITGVDGHYVDRRQLRISSERFVVADLRRPVHFDRNFDLVISLEVAEHLPATSADTFVEVLAGLGPVILFSAAIPFQGGVGHVNEQWPDYWTNRFMARGFSLVDCLRHKIWSDPAVQPYIAQNLVLYVANRYLANSEPLRTEYSRMDGFPLRLVHPDIYLAFSVRRPLGLLLRQWFRRKSRTLAG